VVEWRSSSACHVVPHLMIHWFFNVTRCDEASVVVNCALSLLHIFEWLCSDVLRRSWCSPHRKGSSSTCYRISNAPSTKGVIHLRAARVPTKCRAPIEIQISITILYQWCVSLIWTFGGPHCTAFGSSILVQSVHGVWRFNLLITVYRSVIRLTYRFETQIEFGA